MPITRLSYVLFSVDPSNSMPWSAQITPADAVPDHTTISYTSCFLLILLILCPGPPNTLRRTRCPITRISNVGFSVDPSKSTPRSVQITPADAVPDHMQSFWSF